MKREKVTPRRSDEPTDGELELGLRIDEHALNEALIAQPEFFYRVSKQLVLVISQRDAQKQAVAELEATADAEIRETAIKHKDKTTEPEIKNMIRMDPDVMKGASELLALARRVGELQALKDAFEQRGSVLKSLVSLYISNYYQANLEKGDVGSQNALRDHSASRNREELRERREKYGRK